MTRPRLQSFLVRVRDPEVAADFPLRRSLARRAERPIGASPSRALDAKLRSEGDVLSFARVYEPRAAGGFSEEEERHGLSRTFELVVHSQRSPARVLEVLRGAPLIEGACVNRFVSSFAQLQPASDERVERWAFDEARFDEALAREPGSPNVRVAVLDSGVDRAHPEFDSRLEGGVDFVDAPSELVEDAGLELVGDYQDRDDDPHDDVGHGTLVSSILCARGRSMARGAAGTCTLFPVRVLAAVRKQTGALFGLGTYADIDSALKHAVDRGARVINCSLGSRPAGEADFGLVPHQDSVRYALAHGAVVVAAAGNSGRREQFVPASLPGVLAVGAISPERDLASFSTRGGHVRLLAPGVGIFGASLGASYKLASGTSYAAPYVTAAAALALSAFERRGVPVAASLLRELLVFGAKTYAVGSRGRRPMLIDAAEIVELAATLADARRQSLGKPANERGFRPN